MTGNRTSILIDGAIMALVVALFVGGAAFLFGVRAVPVTNDSMEPGYDAGSLVLTVSTNSTALHAGDVVAFTPPEQYATSDYHLVMHRVVTSVKKDDSLEMVTKGDANLAPDPWVLDLEDADVQRAVLELPYAGHVVAALSGPHGPARLFTVVGLLMVLAAAGAWPRRPEGIECGCKRPVLATD